jgi:peptidoglycan/LPS O-acetylase OafA/YrhL
VSLIHFHWAKVPKQFIIFQNWDYFNPAIWSLKIECIFYLVFPIVVLVVKKIKIRMDFRIEFMILIAVSILIQYLFNYYSVFNYTYNFRQFSSVEFVNYLPCFYLGVKLAMGENRLNTAVVGFFVGIFLLVGSIFYMPLSHMGLGFLYFSLIIAILNFDHLQYFLENRFFVFLGERSYSLFLIHFPVFYLVNDLVATFILTKSFYYGILTRLIGIPLAILLSMVLFYFVERKFAKGLKTSSNFFYKRL